MTNTITNASATLAHESAKGVIDVSIPMLLIIYALLAFPLLVILYFKIPMLKKTVISILRMTVQLAFVGVYLEFLFRMNNVFLNALWVLVMIIVANVTVVQTAGLKLARFFFIVLIGITFGTFAVAGVFVFVVIHPTPLYDAHYLIPITGMILGNCLRANVISLSNFYGALRTREKEYLTYLMLGATRREAVLPYLKDAVKTSLSPTVAMMATTGLVSLPGMMTGQILGGSAPLVAIKYQIAIMIAIFAATAITAILNLFLSMRIAFTNYHILRKDIFAETKV